MKTLLISTLFLINLSFASAEDYRSICGKQLKNNETMEVNLPVGAFVSIHERKSAEGIAFQNAIYIPVISLDGATFCSASLVDNKGIHIASSDISLGECKVGKTIIIRTAGLDVPAIKIKIISVNLDNGYIKAEVTKMVIR